MMKLLFLLLCIFCVQGANYYFSESDGNDGSKWCNSSGMSSFARRAPTSSDSVSEPSMAVVCEIRAIEGVRVCRLGLRQRCGAGETALGETRTIRWSRARPELSMQNPNDDGRLTWGQRGRRRA